MHPHHTHVKKRTITSCLECYRRKQKCDRMKPCNFCISRGVPEICRYGSSTQEIPLEKGDRSYVTANKAQGPLPPISQPDFLDQVGYSSVSRGRDLEIVGESVGGNTRSTNNNQHAATGKLDLYLRLMARLPSDRVTSSLVDAHFSAETWSFPVLDEQHFRQLYEQFKHNTRITSTSNGAFRSLPTLAAFPALLFAILAVTLQFITTDTEQARALELTDSRQCDHASQWYLDTGQEIMALLEQEKPTTTSIEFHLTKMAWLKNCGRGAAAWQSLGKALREAQELDLHQIQDGDSSDHNISVEDALRQLWEVEHRRRLWAKIFIMDSHMATSLGRPRGIHREDCRTSPPLDCDYPSKPSQTLPRTTDHNRQAPSTFSHILFSLALSHEYHDLMSLRALKLELKDFKRIEDLHNDVQSLLIELPPALRPSFPDTSWDHQQPQLPTVRLRLLTTANVFLLALHRPYVSTHVSSRFAAIDAALAILQAQHDLFRLVPQAQHKLYGYSFYIIDAGIFVAATLLKHSTFDDIVYAKVLSALHQAILRLGILKERCHIAQTGELILQRCYVAIGENSPFPPSVEKYPYIESVPEVSEDEVIQYLQDLGPDNSDQATRELLSLLAAQTPTTDSLPAGMSPVSRLDYNEPDLSPASLAANDNFSGADLLG